MYVRCPRTQRPWYCLVLSCFFVWSTLIHELIFTHDAVGHTNPRTHERKTCTLHSFTNTFAWITQTLSGSVLFCYVDHTHPRTRLHERTLRDKLMHELVYVNDVCHTHPRTPLHKSHYGTQSSHELIYPHDAHYPQRTATQLNVYVVCHTHPRTPLHKSHYGTPSSHELTNDTHYPQRTASQLNSCIRMAWFIPLWDLA